MWVLEKRVRAREGDRGPDRSGRAGVIVGLLVGRGMGSARESGDGTGDLEGGGAQGSTTVDDKTRERMGSAWVGEWRPGSDVGDGQ